MVQNPSSEPQGLIGSNMVSFGDNQLIVFAGKGVCGCTNEVHTFNIDRGDEPYSQNNCRSCSELLSDLYYHAHLYVPPLLHESGRVHL